MKNKTNNGKVYYTTTISCKGCEKQIRKMYSPTFTGYCRSCYSEIKKQRNRENIPDKKTCKVCEIEQDISQFSNNKTGLPINTCYRCHSLKKYNLNNKQYNEIAKEQNNCCAICNKSETIENVKGKISLLAVDHCHETGKIRGLLCSKCNQGLGLFNDNIELLNNAIKYLT